MQPLKTIVPFNLDNSRLLEIISLLSQAKQKHEMHIIVPLENGMQYRILTSQIDDFKNALK